MNIDNILIFGGLVAGAFVVLVMAAQSEYRRERRDAKRRNEPAKHRGRIDEKDRPSNLKGW